MQDPRERLLRRVEVEARAFANSDGTTSQLRLGRVQGLLEAGVLAGYWRKRDSAAATELVQHRYRLSKLRDVLLRGDEVKLWKVTDNRRVPRRLDPASRSARSCRAIPGTLRPLGPRTLLGAIERRGLGGGLLVGRGWPSLATQAIGERGSPRWEASESVLWAPHSVSKPFM